MNRLLLAFLALLGIVAQTQPVSARAIDGAEVGVVASQPSAKRAIEACVAAAAALPVHPVADLPRAAPAERLQPAFAPPVPAVRIGVDRAAE